MKCNEFLEHLSQYVENDLSDEKRRECEAHLFSCEECRRAFEEEKEISILFMEAMNDDEIVFESRIDNVMDSIDKEKYSSKKVVSLEAKKRKRFLNKKVAGLAAVCAICLYFTPGVIMSGMNMSKDSAMDDKAFFAGSEAESQNYGTLAGEEEKNDGSNVRSYSNQNRDMGKSFLNKESIITGLSKDEDTAGVCDSVANDEETEEKAADKVGVKPTINTASMEEEDVSTESIDPGSKKEDTPSVPVAINSQKDKNIGKSAVKSATSVPGLSDNEKKLNEALERERYLMENFGIVVIHRDEGSYIDNNSKSQTFGFKFGTIENYVEDEEFVYMIYRGNREKGGDLTSKVLKFNKESKKMEEIYEIKSSEVIDSLKIEEDGLVYTIKYEEKIKNIKIKK